MGQYYHPCIIVQKDGRFVVLAWLNNWAYGSGSKQMEHSYLDNPLVLAFEWLISPEGPHHKSQVAWAGDYGGIEDGYDCNLYNLCDEGNHPNPKPTISKVFPFIVNHTKQCYIDKAEIVGDIHPLPLLTNETDSGGGGDYRGINEHFLGRWARDVISVEDAAPEGFAKVSFEFCE